MRSSLALILLLCVSACGLVPEQIDETKNWSAQKLYSAAKEKLNEGSYEGAIKLYEKLEARYPYGRFAQQAQLEVAYAYYKDKEIASAMSAAERFIKICHDELVELTLLAVEIVHAVRRRTTHYCRCHDLAFVSPSPVEHEVLADPSIQISQLAPKQ